MGRSDVWTVTCDVDTTTTATMSTPEQPPSGWVRVTGLTYGVKGFNAGAWNDICPTCASSLPSPFQALIPPPPP